MLWKYAHREPFFVASQLQRMLCAILFSRANAQLIAFLRTKTCGESPDLTPKVRSGARDYYNYPWVQRKYRCIFLCRVEPPRSAVSIHWLSILLWVKLFLLAITQVTSISDKPWHIWWKLWDWCVMSWRCEFHENEQNTNCNVQHHRPRRYIYNVPISRANNRHSLGQAAWYSARGRRNTICGGSAWLV